MVGDDGLITDVQSDPIAAEKYWRFPDHPLCQIYFDVVQQVMFGKGERHGGAVKPFMTQIWHTIANTHGIGFLTGQAQKKMCEAMESGNMTANPDAFEREMLGAIAYMGMAMIQYRKFRDTQ